MTEYTLQIPDNILATVRQIAEKNHISVNQFLLTATINSLLTANSIDVTHEQVMIDAEIDKIPLTEQPLKWGSFLQVARSLEVEGPPDWSENIDDYLYGDK